MTTNIEVSPRSRRPLWSQALTIPLARWMPAGWRPMALTVVKALHTVIFASVSGAILLFAWEGLRQRPGRRAAIALLVALGETAIYVSNNQVCPLTPLAEELGAERGSVSDSFLPDWIGRRIPLFAGGAVLVGLALNGHGLVRARRR